MSDEHVHTTPHRMASTIEQRLAVEATLGDVFGWDGQPRRMIIGLIRSTCQPPVQTTDRRIRRPPRMATRRPTTISGTAATKLMAA